jgi:hypothetical protein
MTDIKKRKLKIGACVAAGLFVLFIVWGPGSFYRVRCLGFLNIKPLQLKGLAVDSAGVPLAGVKIQLSWSTAGFLIGLPMDHNKTTWVTSDKNGAWTFKLDKPSQVSIRIATKEGYAFDRLRSSMSDLAGLAERQRLTEYPATVVMRKRLEEVLLLGYKELYDFGELYMWAQQGTSKQINFDILASYENRKKPEYADLQISTSFDSTNTCWMLTFRVLDGLGGLVNTNELLFEAPKEGYTPEVNFRVAIKDRTPEERNYLYLKSQKQGLYTRIVYSYDSWNDDRTGPNFRLYLGTATNPYGERSFEDATELRKYIFARDELLEEAKKAIRSGTLPKKPENLEKHLQERDKILKNR